MKQLCCSKYEQEIIEQGFHLLQQKITYYHESCPLMENSTIISLLPMLNSLQDPNIREQLIEQYRETTKKAIDDIFSVYKEAAEKRRQKYSKKFDTDMKKM
ncbi:unnamed protein product [Rotaria sordida]|uniref:Uncharacterized protein n=1 Tax=Rotaria sordida TaxID=392033 RepID=A0A815VJF6_9BILA|nr:unnamed protein product [Rotaria sordida]CAF1529082.1 unnamed protein product [Rotaria sordida]CAF4091282.1 unnamed protein product [Rotaria sordida]CAF4130603.1 unnamed protein product [Rotaria sordida]